MPTRSDRSTRVSGAERIVVNLASASAANSGIVFAIPRPCVVEEIAFTLAVQSNGGAAGFATAQVTRNSTTLDIGTLAHAVVAVGAANLQSSTGLVVHPEITMVPKETLNIVTGTSTGTVYAVAVIILRISPIG
jgi:hypothetical protein